MVPSSRGPSLLALTTVPSMCSTSAASGRSVVRSFSSSPKGSHDATSASTSAVPERTKKPGFRSRTAALTPGASWCVRHSSVRCTGTPGPVAKKSARFLGSVLLWDPGPPLSG